MAVYKVIQDIEAEDKIVGFLSLKSFIYALIASALAYINLRMFMSGALGPLRFVFVFILFFPMLLFGVLAAPLGRDQPTEVWILSHIRFFLKPHMRIWDQSGKQELVTITAPKKIERTLTKDITQTEVQSRLKALATTLDSRGWAVKNVAVNLSANPSYLDVTPVNSDRLVNSSHVAEEQFAGDIQASDDIMDEQNNPTAQHFQDLMQKADAKRREQVQERLNQARQQKSPAAEPVDYQFLDQVQAPMDQKGNTSFVAHKIIAPGSNAEQADKPQVGVGEAEEEFLEKMHEKARVVHARSAGFKLKSPEEAEAVPTSTPAIILPAQQTAQAPVTASPQNVKLKELMEVAQGDRISTLAQEANRPQYRIKQVAPGEVEIDLH